ncbi:MAG: hypothetical protein MJ198_05510 [Bacteroidales bacterium]|nr:hypothetical protein [Bacteroidales bacterium]
MKRLTEFIKEFPKKIKTFKEYCENSEEISNKDEFRIDMLFYEEEQQKSPCNLLLEYEHLKNIPGTIMSARYDHGNTNTKTQDHFHVYLKGNQIYAINRDGSSHDGTYNRKLNKKEIKFFTQYGFSIPDNGILECIDIDINRTLPSIDLKNCYHLLLD